MDAVKGMAGPGRAHPCRPLGAAMERRNPAQPDRIVGQAFLVPFFATEKRNSPGWAKREGSGYWAISLNKEVISRGGIGSAKNLIRRTLIQSNACGSHAPRLREAERLWALDRGDNRNAATQLSFRRLADHSPTECRVKIRRPDRHLPSVRRCTITKLNVTGELASHQRARVLRLARMPRRILIVPTLRVAMQLQTLCVCGTRSVPGSGAHAGAWAPSECSDSAVFQATRCPNPLTEGRVEVLRRG